VSVSAVGALTLHGVTRTVTISLQAMRSGGIIAVTGSLPIVFSDYAIAKPNSFSRCCRSTITASWNCTFCSLTPETRWRPGTEPPTTQHPATAAFNQLRRSPPCHSCAFLGGRPGQPVPAAAPAGPDLSIETDAVRRIVTRLEALPAGQARLLAGMAYLLARAAYADLEISDAETTAMEQV